MPLQKALVWTLLGGYLLLPSATSFKLPMLPSLDKSLIPSVSALVLCHIHAPKLSLAADWTGRTGRVVIISLFLTLVSAPIFTVYQNAEPLIYGPTFIPGLRLYDALSMISVILVAILPFWLGLRYLNNREGHLVVLQAFVFGALFYTLPALLEVRLSPQLHNWIYGFFPHDFVQHVRAGGFRPVVFLSHGLLVGIFLSMSVIAALALWREAVRQGKTASGWVFAAIWIMIVLFLSKNLGALAIAIALSALVIFTGRRVQSTFALVIATALIIYPMLRGAGFVPVDAVYNFALSVNEERAASLKFRFDHEDALLARANEKPLFGWGSWGRNQIYDPETGRLNSVTDGVWIILIGIYGWVGYVAHFGLITIPILFNFLRRSRFGPSLVTPGLMMVLSVAMIDMIPNAGLVPYVWLIAGGLAGYVLWRPEEAADGATPVLGQGDQKGFAGGDIGPPSWVMSASGPAQRRPRRARQRRLE
ncbi:hypothetical protein EI545_17730 [Tabrizicola piscis]|uniref:O-antigen ligase domain-containing protein n=1 Tax=Tabrizicola piscis TaxID=2494374 RepID=A0A3S8U9T5_9RHOB|nr:hypothetical protein [Tabrizicola piscis]AZL60502.1 hypothetical protein EI545_17730 [Tabrizicola piscis]